MAKANPSNSSKAGAGPGCTWARSVTGSRPAPPPARYSTLMSSGSSVAATSGSAGAESRARIRGTRNSSTRNRPETTVLAKRRAGPGPAAGWSITTV